MTSPTVKLETIKTLVALHGQRKAARIAGLNENTVRTWAMRFKWPCPKYQRAETLAIAHSKTSQPIVNQSPASIVTSELENNRQRSKLALSRYVASASEQANNVEGKLAITRKAKDLADIHSTIFPESSESKQILNLQIVTGAFIPGDNPPSQ